MENMVFIDGQNLHISTTKAVKPWSIDLVRFKIYLNKKYSAGTIYYFMGYKLESNTYLYKQIEGSGFKIIFKEQSNKSLSFKKGNVDTDLVFEVMKMVYKSLVSCGIIIVSGDGDYKKLVDFLIEEGKFTKIMFPNREYRSSLYKGLGNRHFLYLDDEDVKNKIQKK